MLLLMLKGVGVALVPCPVSFMVAQLVQLQFQRDEKLNSKSYGPINTSSASLS